MSDRFELEEHDYYGSGHWFMGVAGTALGNRKLVRIGADGLIYLADAGAAATMPCMGITLATAVAGQNIKVLVQGFLYSADGPWTPGSELYVSDTAGEMSHVAGTVSQEVGLGYTTTILYFDPARGGGGGISRGIDDVFIPVPNPNSYVGDHSAVRLTDDVDVLVRMDFFLPLEFDITTWSVDVLVIAGGTGNLRRGVDTDFGLITELYNVNSDTIAAGVVAVTINLITAIDITAALTGSTALDTVGMEFTRYGSDGTDTVDADCYMLGVLIRRP